MMNTNDVDLIQTDFGWRSRRVYQIGEQIPEMGARTHLAKDR